jgi:hypothetical protein
MSLGPTDNPWELMRAAMTRACAVTSAGDSMIAQLAEIMSGRLRLVPASVLVRLKRELRDFDAQKRRWKS